MIICTYTFIICIMYHFESNLISHRLQPVFSSVNVLFTKKETILNSLRSLFGLYDLCFLRMEVGNLRTVGNQFTIANKSDIWIEMSCYRREWTRKQRCTLTIFMLNPISPVHMKQFETFETRDNAIKEEYPVHVQIEGRTSQTTKL